MRIALVCPYSLSWPGGVQAHVVSLGVALSRRGHRVIVVGPLDGQPAYPSLHVTGDPSPEHAGASARPRGADSADSDPARLSEDGHDSARRGRRGASMLALCPVGRSVPVPANRSVARLAFSPLVYARIGRLLRVFEPEVMHVHEPLQAGVSLLSLLRRGLPPSVGTFHAAAARMRPYDWFRPVFGALLGRVHVLAAVSPEARELIARHFGPGVAERTRILPNGVDVERFAGGPEASRRPPEVVFVGRLEPRKGCDVLLEAWRILQRGRALPEDAVLRIVGDGPLRARLQHLGERAGGVVFEGRVTDDALVDRLRSAAVLCVPSVESESFGIVLLEGMAAGAAVLASDLPGYRWVGDDAARYFRTGDPGALAQGLEVLLTDARLRAELAERGRLRASQFDWQVLLPRVEQAYSDAKEAACRPTK